MFEMTSNEATGIIGSLLWATYPLQPGESWATWNTLGHIPQVV